jgi:hypothetical protein
MSASKKMSGAATLSARQRILTLDECVSEEVEG